MEDIVITVLIPAYNASKTISKTLDSVLKQTYDQSKIKFIIIDDGSTDNTLSILKEFQSLIPDRVQIISRENKGISQTRNELLKSVKTNWFIFLDADDLYTSTAFENLVSCVKVDTDIVYAKTV
jgi:glycosyltransferase involved in cell wall biosynthesis